MSRTDIHSNWEAMMESMGAIGGTSIDAVSTTGQSASEQGLKEKAVSQAQGLVDRARSTAQDRVRSSIASGKSMAVDALSGVAQSLGVASQQLKQQQNGAGEVIEQAAERLDRIAQYLDTSEVEDLVSTTETWARRNPALFFGAAFVLGALGARFLKSSRPSPISGSGTLRPRSASTHSSTFTDREVPTTHAVEELP